MEIKIENHRYGPNPHRLRQGGTLYYEFNVEFDGPPPTEFDWTIRMRDAGKNLVKTLTGTTPTRGEPVVTVVVNLPATKDSGGLLDFGNYSNQFEVQASGYPTFDQVLCSGRTIVPEDCDCAAWCKI